MSSLIIKILRLYQLIFVCLPIHICLLISSYLSAYEIIFVSLSIHNCVLIYSYLYDWKFIFVCLSIHICLLINSYLSDYQFIFVCLSIHICLSAHLIPNHFSLYIENGHSKAGSTLTPEQKNKWSASIFSNPQNKSETFFISRLTLPKPAHLLPCECLTPAGGHHFWQE